jgi:hypothetical protein
VQGLAHPWFEGMHDPNDEPLMSQPLPSDPEVDELSSSEVRTAILIEMAEYNPELRAFVA